MVELRNEHNILLVIIFAIVSIGAFALFGITGLRTILGLAVFILFPFYLILNNFDLSQQEKIFFSFFIGVTLFPSFVYWLGFVVPFRISILAVFIILLAAGFLIKKFWKK